MDNDLKEFEKFMRHNHLSDNTIISYLWTANDYLKKQGGLSRQNIMIYRAHLLQFYSPRTANLRIQGLNKFLEYNRKNQWKIKAIKLQQKPFLENVVSNADYKYFKRRLKKDENIKYYFLVWFMAATGARVGETVKLKVEHIEIGYLDIYSKGGKLRRIYIPDRLQKGMKNWMQKENVTSGYVFLNKNGIQISCRGIAKQLKIYARKYGIDEKVIYPHSFRHLFGKNFIEKNEDLALLADLMGHKNIETTRIYLRRTANEQRRIVNQTVTW